MPARGRASVFDCNIKNIVCPANLDSFAKEFGSSVLTFKQALLLWRNFRPLVHPLRE
jgi:hypothetical protein